MEILFFCFFTEQAVLEAISCYLCEMFDPDPQTVSWGLWSWKMLRLLKPRADGEKGGLGSWTWRKCQGRLVVDNLYILVRARRCVPVCAASFLRSRKRRLDWGIVSIRSDQPCSLPQRANLCQKTDDKRCIFTETHEEQDINMNVQIK